MKLIRGSVSKSAAVAVASTLIASGTVMAAPSATAAPDFYRPPASFDATPGSVIRTLPVPLALKGKGVPARATKILYTSTRVDGKPTAVSGYVVKSTLPWRGPGPRPTLIAGSGTVGQGDQCPSSRTLSTATSSQVSDAITGFAAEGVNVVVSDYIGLGTPGIHTYADRVETGNAMLDAARAGLTLTGAGASDPIGFHGYSQGGGAAASAAELASTYAPELTVKGSYAGAPPADLSKVIDHIDGTSIAAGIGYAVNGMYDRYPEVRSILNKNLSAHGKHVLKTISTQCLENSVMSFGLMHTSSWTKSGEPLSRIINRNPAARRVMNDQKIGRLKPSAPVLLGTGINDDIVPTGQVEQLARDWRAKGVKVKVIRDHTPSILPGTGAGHSIPTPGFEPKAKAFLMNEFRH